MKLDIQIQSVWSEMTIKMQSDNSENYPTKKIVTVIAKNRDQPLPNRPPTQDTLYLQGSNWKAGLIIRNFTSQSLSTVHALSESSSVYHLKYQKIQETAA